MVSPSTLVLLGTFIEQQIIVISNMDAPTNAVAAVSVSNAPDRTMDWRSHAQIFWEPDAFAKWPAGNQWIKYSDAWANRNGQKSTDKLLCSL